MERELNDIKDHKSNLASKPPRRINMRWEVLGVAG